ncbi:MAG: PIN domain-containing protein [Gammaproteobacteria bacterium]
MKNFKPFFDTDILLYLMSEDTDKANRAEQLVLIGGSINVQVLNEFTALAERTLNMSHAEIRDILRTIRNLCDISPITVEIHDQAMELGERLGLPVYDAMIISAALNAECNILFSETMQHGRQIDNRLAIINPFFQ